MQALARGPTRSSFSILQCGGRFRSAYATNSLRPLARSGRCFLTQSTHSQSQPLQRALNSTRDSRRSKHMGGGPKLPLSTMHRAPAAMVTKPVDVEVRTPRDPNTLSNYHNYVTRHTSVDFEIDFEKKRLVGSVVLKLESLVDEKVDVVLDSRYVSSQDNASSTDGTGRSVW